MKTKTFQDLQAELGELLKPFIGKKQDGKVEKDAQDTVDRYFRKCRARAIHTVLGDAGLSITGIKLGFDIGSIGLKQVVTDYWPNDQYAVIQTVKGAVPLGYVNGYQLYIEKKEGEYPILVARYGMGNCITSWCPKLQGVPTANSVFFIALERAKQLGYLDYLGEL
jgi:hypothetical protein